MAERNSSESIIYVTVRLSQEEVQMLDRIMESYRAPSRAHALRLTIEDRFKEIEDNAT